MTTYTAFIRGIGPTNPNMRNEKLRGVFEKLGFEDVKTVISSGNVVFSSKSKNVGKLENIIEKALTLRLGLENAVFVRSKDELDGLIRCDPFKGKEHGRKSYLIVTFTKGKPQEIFNVLDTTKGKTVDFMAKLEKEHGKVITTRTWQTVKRIVEKMGTSTATRR
jgi:uncharacterized protein (DUF1697 family)